MKTLEESLGGRHYCWRHGSDDHDEHHHPTHQGLLRSLREKSKHVQDIDLIASQYPDSFMVAGPNGAKVAQKSAVVAAFPQGQAALKSLGHESTEVLSLNETRIDEHY